MYEAKPNSGPLKSEDVAKWKKSLAMLRNLYGI